MALTQGDPGEGRVHTETPSPAWELESGREQGPQVPLGEWTLLGGHRGPWGLEWVTCSWKTPRAGALPDAASSFLLNPGSTSELDIVPGPGPQPGLTPSGSAAFGQQSFARLSCFAGQTLSESAGGAVGVEGWRRAGARAGSRGVKYTVAWLSRLGRG